MSTELDLELDNLFASDEISLEALAGVDLREITPVRFVQFPAGSYQWIIEGPEGAAPVSMLKTEIADKRTDIVGAKREVPVIGIWLKCIDVYKQSPVEGMSQDDLREATIGRYYQEKFFIKEKKDLQRFVAFTIDIGVVAPLAEACENMSGVIFDAPISHARNKNDPDNPYINLVREKIKLAA